MRGGEVGKVVEELVLEALVVDGPVRVESPLVMPVAAGGPCLRIIAGRQPLLGEVPEPEVVGRAGAAHPRRPSQPVRRPGDEDATHALTNDLMRAAVS